MIKTKYTVLSFDMGKGNTGWNIIEFNIKTKKFKVLKTGVINASKTTSRKDYKGLIHQFGEPVITFGVLAEAIEELIVENQPDYLASEGAWYGVRLTAYTSLIMCIFVAKMVGRKHNLRVYEITPKQAKACIAKHGASDKEEVYDAILNNPDIKFASGINKKELTKDQSDSISIGYTFCIQLLPEILNKK